MPPEIRFGILLTNLAAMLIIGLSAFRALVHFGYGGHRILSEGVLTALSFFLAGTLLRSIQLQTWEQIGSLFAILSIRTFLKAMFKRPVPK